MREREEPVRRIKRVEALVEVAVCPARGCWVEFKPIRSNQTFCSNACRQRSWQSRPADGGGRSADGQGGSSDG